MPTIRLVTAALILIWAWAMPALALTPEEVIKLKQAGVSDATIQKMLDQERSGNVTRTGPITETDDQVIYRAGQGNAEDNRRNERHERWKEEKSMDALKNVIIDGRTSGVPPTGQ
jgi:hypothetical protein